MATKITSAEIIRLARESDTGADRFSFPVEFLERFAALVADAQREIDAQICKAKSPAEYATGKVDHNEMAWCESCAFDILANKD